MYNQVHIRLASLTTKRKNLGNEVEVKKEKEPKIMFNLKITNITTYQHNLIANMSNLA